VLQRIKQLIDEGVVVSRAAERVHREMASVSEAPHNETAASAATSDGQETDAA